jgi:large subunit ribosomal protein L13
MSSYTAGTYTITPKEINKSWLLIDAKGMVLGRLASEIAKILRGKHKASYTPNMDCGDNIIVINAGQVHLTGKKEEKELFFWHTGHPGGIKERSIGKILSGRFPERVIKKAVQRMLPKESPLARKQFANLYVYSGENHPHAGQTPIQLDLAARNRKNIKS